MERVKIRSYLAISKYLALENDEDSVEGSENNDYEFRRCCGFRQSYEIKSPPWTILWFRILGIIFVENIARLGVFMFQTSDNGQLYIDSQYSYK